MSTNTESIYAMYFYHVRVLFSWLHAFFVKNLAFHRKTLTFFNFLNYWISVISFAAYVVCGVLCQLIASFSQQVSFLGEKMCFCYKNFRNFSTFLFLSSRLRYSQTWLSIISTSRTCISCSSDFVYLCETYYVSWNNIIGVSPDFSFQRLVVTMACTCYRWMGMLNLSSWVESTDQQ